MGYENFGLKENPFFTDALQPDKDSMQKFIGRKSEIKAFLTTMSNPEGCTHIVTGQRGTGKTSFINVMQYLCTFDNPTEKSQLDVASAPRKMLPCYQKLQVAPNETLNSLLFRVVTVLLLSATKYCTEHELGIDSEIQKLDQEFNQIIVNESDNKYNTNVLQKKIEQIINIFQTKYDREGVFLIIDNIDILDTQFLVNLLNEARMYLLEIPNLYIVLTGDVGLFAAIASAEDGERVTDVLRGNETELSDFSENEVIEIIKLRVKDAEIESGKGKLPIEERVIKELYKNCNGQIRLLFSICDALVLKAQIAFPNLKEQITNILIQPNLKAIVRHHVGWDLLSKKEKILLKKTFDKGNIRSKDYKELGLDRHMSVKSMMDRLIKSGHVHRTQGLPGEVRAVLYKVTGKVTLANYAKLFEDLNKAE